MTPNLSRRTLNWTKAGVVIAALSILVAVLLTVSPWEWGDARSQTQSGDGNQQVGDDSIVAGGDISIRAERFAEEARGMSREAAERLAAEYRDVPPPETGPAPFLIIDAPRNVFVRSDGTVDGHRIGAVFNGATVWAECTGITNFDPDLTDAADATWLRIHWHTDEPNEDMASSQPSGEYRAWIYAGLTLPAGHNGRIPQCEPA